MDRKELLMQAGAEYSKENYESVIRLLSTYPDDAEVLFNKAIANRHQSLGIYTFAYQVNSNY